MNYIIHITDECNLRCKYCYKNKKKEIIDFENIKNIIDREIRNNTKTNITFYGGEPLLEKEIIYKTIDYIKRKRKKKKFVYQMTTNGTLLDDEFIKIIKKNNFINIGYSLDGMEYTQNLNRKTCGGENTFYIVKNNLDKLLKNNINVTVMTVVTKNNLQNLSNNVRYFIENGAKKINLSFNYFEDWDDEDLENIRKEYRKVGEILYYNLKNENDIDIYPFSEKIYSHINGKNCNENCMMGFKNIYVDVNGNFYPCEQFVGEKEFVIGNCNEGIDKEKRNKIIKQKKEENEECKECSIKMRCMHTCACRNYITTNDINKVSPLVCEMEKIIVRVSDDVAGKLYKEKSKLFMQKYYNQNYSIINKIVGIIGGK